MTALSSEQEIRLRVVEALTRTDGSMAKNQPEAFIASVAKITTFVINGNQAEKPVEEAPLRKPTRPKTDKAAEVPDFM